MHEHVFYSESYSMPAALSVIFIHSSLTFIDSSVSCHNTCTVCMYSVVGPIQ